jgi:hypothetical protein
MPKTDNTFVDYFLLTVGLLPLLTVLLIFLKRVWFKEQFVFLMIICLFKSIESVLLRASSLAPENEYFIINVFSLIELPPLILLFRPLLDGKAKRRLDIFMVGFVSVAITYFSLRGWGNAGRVFGILESGIIVAVILISLPQHIRTANLDIFHSPLFWIASGTLFYFIISLLLEWAGTLSPLPDNPDTGQLLFLTLAGFVRFLLYIAAVMIACQKDTMPME